MKIIINDYNFSRLQAGFSLLEVLLASVLISYGMVKVVDMTKASVDEVKTQNTATHMNRVVLALHEYAQKNYASLANDLSGASNKIVTVNDLISGSYLPPGFSATNPYQQIVRGQFISASGYGLIGLAQAVSGSTFTQKEASDISLKLGAKGGYVTSTISGSQTLFTLNGSYQGWKLDLNSPAYTKFSDIKTENQLVAYLNMDGGFGSPSDNDYIKRHINNNNPELNAMEAPLSLLNASKLVASGDIIGQSCNNYATNSFASTASGVPIVCTITASNQKIWSNLKTVNSVWKDPVSSLSGLPTSNCPTGINNQNCNNFGDVRVANDTLVPWIWTGTAWQKFGPNTSGDMSIPGIFQSSSIKTDTINPVNANNIIKVKALIVPSDLQKNDQEACDSSQLGSITIDQDGDLITCHRELDEPDKRKKRTSSYSYQWARVLYDQENEKNKKKNK